MRATSHWAWLHSHQPSHNHISPHTSGRTRPRMGSVNTPANPKMRATSHWAWLHSHQPSHNHISPHTSGRTRPRMGSVNTPANPKTRATSHWAWLHSHQPSYYHLGLATFSPAILLSLGPGYILTSHHTITWAST
ncbi:unnamed protein product [Prunus armeniaca]